MDTISTLFALPRAWLHKEQTMYEGHLAVKPVIPVFVYPIYGIAAFPNACTRIIDQPVHNN